jgi:hypothetical protein
VLAVAGTTAFITDGDRGTGHVNECLSAWSVKVRTDPVRGKARSQMISTWLAANQTDGNGSAAGRIALVAVAVLAIVAYALLQLQARSRRASAGRRRYDPWDWRTYPPESRPAGPDAGVPYGNEESSRPDWRYGYPPGYEPYPLYDQARSPWAVRDQASSDRRSLAAPGGPAGGPAAGRLPKPGPACLRYLYR